MRTVYLVDLDDVLVAPGTRDLIPGAKERLDALAADPATDVWIFSPLMCDDPDGKFLRSTFPYMRGFIRLPVADQYVVVGAKLNRHLCATSMGRAFEYATLCPNCAEAPKSLVPARICPHCGHTDLEMSPDVDPGKTD